VGLLALNHGIQTLHPYLNPLNPDRDRLAAEKILSLKDNVLAGRYADWVLRYAYELEEKGESNEAIHFYREGVRLDPANRAAYERLTALEALESGETTESHAGASIAVRAPYWTADKPVVKPPRHAINLDLETVEGWTVVVVPVGNVPDEILDSVGYAIRNELGLPVFISPDTVKLPPTHENVACLTHPSGMGPRSCRHSRMQPPFFRRHLSNIS
jgi:hypothetical protein